MTTIIIPPLKIKVRKWAVFEAQNLNYEKDKLDKPEKEVNKMKKEITTIKEMQLHGTLNKLTKQLNEEIKRTTDNFIGVQLLRKLKENGYNDLNVSAEIIENFVAISIFKENKRVGAFNISFKQVLVISYDGTLFPDVKIELSPWEWDNLFKELKENIK